MVPRCFWLWAEDCGLKTVGLGPWLGRPHRGPRAKCVVPAHEPRAARAHVTDGVAELQPADRHGRADLRKVDLRAEVDRGLFEGVEALPRLLRLALDPV